VLAPHLASRWEPCTLICRYPDPSFTNGDLQLSMNPLKHVASDPCERTLFDSQIHYTRSCYRLQLSSTSSLAYSAQLEMATVTPEVGAAVSCRKNTGR
jgi:hypothetical protein